MDHQAASAYLLAARQNGPGAPLPEALRPKTEADAYEIQRLTMAHLGPIGGWKVGADSPQGAPTCAPMPAAGLHASPAVLHSADFTTREIESEIGYRLAHDLPPRPTPYTTEDVVAAIEGCHPGIEVVQSRFAGEADPLSHLADLLRHGAYIVGEPIPGWHAIDFATVAVTQTIDEVATHQKGNPAGDMLRLVVWLANTGAVWAGGLRAGQVVTCGSWTGKIPAPELSKVEADFSVAVPVELAFA